MATHLKEVDHYIEQSAEFARPILVHLRQLIHSCEPLVEEKIKWGMPFFEYKGPWPIWLLSRLTVLLDFGKPRL